MDVYGHYKPYLEESVAIEDLVGINVVRICGDLGFAHKPQFLVTRTQSTTEGGGYWPGEVTFSAAGVKCTSNSIFIVPHSVLLDITSKVATLDDLRRFVWPIIFRLVRRYVQDQCVSSEDQLLNLSLMEPVSRTHPTIHRSLVKGVSDWFTKANLDERGMKEAADAEIVNLLARGLQYHNLSQTGEFDYKELKSILGATRQTFDPTWLDLVPRAP